MGWSVPIQPVAYTPQVATDVTPRTVTGTSFTQVSGDFTVPANDPDVGSVYVITCFGTVSWQTTGGTPKYQVVIFGTNLATINLVTGDAGTLSADFTLDVTLIMSAVGASGSVSGYAQISGVVTPGTSLIAGYTVIPATVVNTTAASIIGIQGAFTSGVGSPTMTGDGTIYNRIGPGAVAQ